MKMSWLDNDSFLFPTFLVFPLSLRLSLLPCVTLCVCVGVCLFVPCILPLCTCAIPHLLSVISSPAALKPRSLPYSLSDRSISNKCYTLRPVASSLGVIFSCVVTLCASSSNYSCAPVLKLPLPAMTSPSCLRQAFLHQGPLSGLQPLCLLTPTLCTHLSFFFPFYL